jgi:hypothetical protein
VQLYGGSLFKYILFPFQTFPRRYSSCHYLRSIVDAADAAFCTMPPPQGRVVPARDQPAHAVRGASSSAAAAPPAVDMSAFMDRYGGCFAPQVTIATRTDGAAAAAEVAFARNQESARDKSHRLTNHYPPPVPCQACRRFYHRHRKPTTWRSVVARLPC